MVASSANVCCASATSRFQSPSLRGSGRFGLRARAPRSVIYLVSIPFIAGQWSLRLVRLPDHPQIQVSIPFIAGQWSLLTNTRLMKALLPPVSIPFIAGQWSLRILDTILTVPSVLFQSPSLRGSGRFSPTVLAIAVAGLVFQSPSLRGSGRFASTVSRADDVVLFQSPSLRGSGRFGLQLAFGHSPNVLVSIPFIAGQWSLREYTFCGA